MNKGSESMEGNEKPVRGIVTARICEHCGHHEIGITTDAGEFMALKPGMRILVEGDEPS